MAVTLLLLLAWCFEASFRVLKSTKARVDALEEALNMPRQKERELLVSQRMADRARLAEYIILRREDTFRARGDPMPPDNRTRYDDGAVLHARFAGDPIFDALWQEFNEATGEYVVEALNRSAEMSNAPEDQKMTVLARHLIFPGPAKARLEKASHALVRHLLPEA